MYLRRCCMRRAGDGKGAGVYEQKVLHEAGGGMGRVQVYLSRRCCMRRAGGWEGCRCQRRLSTHTNTGRVSLIHASGRITFTFTLYLYSHQPGVPQTIAAPPCCQHTHVHAALPSHTRRQHAPQHQQHTPSALTSLQQRRLLPGHGCCAAFPSHTLIQRAPKQRCTLTLQHSKHPKKHQPTPRALTRLQQRRLLPAWVLRLRFRRTL